ncbi:sensor histidine kinase [Streptomyces celluloflavus]|uniref:histidine kinase n=1 Tax=Streptomyces celluloflavus TaxID=58344 RepID=A0ABW7R5U4_9ACTN|nr:histidine kinase [Streptomyces celluloflavus]
MSGTGVRRVGELTARHPLATDAVFTLGVMVLGLPSVVGPHPAQVGASPWLLRLLQIGLTAPLLWRRRRPLTVCYAIAAVTVVQWLLPGGWLQGDIALLIAVYGVAVRTARSRLLPVIAVYEATAVLVAVRWQPADWPAALVLLTVAGGATVALGVAVRFRRAYLAALWDRAERMEVERDQRARLSAAAERARIAREMHDIITHNLSVMIGLADGARYSLRSTPERAEQAMEGVSDTGRQALGELRRLLHVLGEEEPTPGLGPQPGLAELDGLLDRVRDAGLPVELRASGDPPNPSDPPNPQDLTDLPAGLQLAVYRIAQEALTNTLKHGGRDATARVRLRSLPDAVEVEIVDTGRGERHRESEGRGIAGMTERASAYGGTVEAGPHAGGGWRVRARLSIQPAGHGGAPTRSWE